MPAHSDTADSPLQPPPASANCCGTAQIYEYGPAMMRQMPGDRAMERGRFHHFDYRSSVSTMRSIWRRVTRAGGPFEDDFRRDLAVSHRVTYDRWRGGPILARAHEWLGWILERQE